MSTTNLLPVYARREPTADRISLTRGCGHMKDTVFYRDPQCKQLMARKPWHQSGHPRSNTRTVTLNCYRWQLQWVT